VRITILGSGGGAPSDLRETASLLIREDDRALLLDAGTGVRRLVTDSGYLDGVAHLDVVLTHFHLDHVCGLAYLRMLETTAAIWAPGEWLYDTASAVILAPLRRPPIAPTDVSEIYAVHELRAGAQEIGGFAVRASAQPRHWAPTAGLRVGDRLALITDTAYEPASAHLADGVEFLLHEAWSSSGSPRHPECDATSADAARVARDAGVERLTLIHLDPAVPDHAPLLADAKAGFSRVQLGRDELVLA
jgi:ribonuclease BN (tRNA processing enzyme)